MYITLIKKVYMIQVTSINEKTTLVKQVSPFFVSFEYSQFRITSFNPHIIHTISRETPVAGKQI